MNIPTLFIFYRYVSKSTFFLTIYGIISLSLTLRIFEEIGPLLPNLQDHMLLAALGFAITVGLGTAIILKADGTSGGAAIVAKLLKDLWDIPVAKTFIVFDSVVILSSLFFFVDFIAAFYSLIALYVMSVIINKYMEGFFGGYQVLIFSDKQEEIKQTIQRELARGVTLIHGTGGYSNFDRKIVLVVIPKKQLLAIKNIIYTIDPGSFVSVSHTYETLGEGFTLEQRKVSPRHSMKPKRIHF
jgi:uncharacterized membrane-anchored protein YitT (DUF2179 family)